MEITARDLSRLLELNKKQAEIEFKRTVFGSDDGSQKDISANASELTAKAAMAKVVLAVPNQEKLDSLGAKLASVPPSALREALKVKDGSPYEVLRERGLIVKRNHENRLEIAKLSIMIAKAAAPEKAALLTAVRSGAVNETIGIQSLDEKDVGKIARFLRRCGLRCKASGKEIAPSEDAKEEEVRLDISNRSVWVSEGSRGLVEENLRRMHAVNAAIQLRNAERQIKSFSEDEESGFATLQKEYLELLKQQDELLKEFNEEERLAVKA